MKMKIYNQYTIVISVILSAILVSSCEKEIDVDLRTASPRLVIEGILPENSVANIKLTTTIGFYEPNTFPPISNAKVELSDDLGNHEILAFDADGKFYSNSIKGIAGRTYTLKVEYDNETYTAISKLPPRVEIDSLGFEYMAVVMPYPYPKIYFTDPVGEDNQYYRTMVYLNGKRIKKDDGALSMEYNDGQSISLFVTVPPESNGDDPYKEGDIITVEMQSIDKGAFTYFSTLGQIDNSLNNPTTNFDGNVLGYFNAYSSDQKSVIIAKWD